MYQIYSSLTSVILEKFTTVIKGGKMYQTKKPNKTNLFVRECITSALFSLMEKYPFEEITVTDIINKAGVSRMGFYRNYSSKENVVESFVLEKFVDTIYTVFSKTNATTLRELGDNWFSSAVIVLKSVKNLDEETRSAVTQALLLLAKSAKTGMFQMLQHS